MPDDTIDLVLMSIIHLASYSHLTNLVRRKLCHLLLKYIVSDGFSISHAVTVLGIRGASQTLMVLSAELVAAVKTDGQSTSDSSYSSHTLPPLYQDTDDTGLRWAFHTLCFGSYLMAKNPS